VHGWRAFERAAYAGSMMLARRIYSTVFWLFLVLSSFALFPIALAIWATTALFDKRLAILHQFTCFWGSLYTFVNPLWPVSITGREKIESGKTYVMVANHLSLLDILVLFRIYKHFKWVSKIENFRLPCIGWNMRLNRYIPLRRGDRESVRQMMDACETTLRAGSSIMMFPEGTRSKNGVLQPFKTGAFELALRTGLPLLPIVLTGTSDALPKKGFVLRGRHPITITVLDPIPPERFLGLDAKALAELTRQIFVEHQDAA
jgi:1-acyl-sn-glycerol-3-phosphate acyltransferase